MQANFPPYPLIAATCAPASLSLDRVDSFMEEEIWKDIVGFEGLYQVSSLARVRSLDRFVRVRGNGFRTINGQIIKQLFNKQTGYYFVVLNKQRRSFPKTIHRLVCNAFHANPLNKKATNHKDGAKTNNLPSNLEHCTYSENNKHAYKNNLKEPTILQGEKHPLSTLKNSDIITMRNRYDSGEPNASIYKDFNIDRNHCLKIVKRKLWKHIR